MHGYEPRVARFQIKITIYIWAHSSILTQNTTMHMSLKLHLCEKTPEFCLEHHLSDRARNRPPLKHFGTKDPSIVPEKPMISLSGGSPNHGMFPVDSIVYNMIDKPFEMNQHTEPDFARVLKSSSSSSSGFGGNDPEKGPENLYPPKDQEFRNHVTRQSASSTLVSKETASTVNAIPLKVAFQYQGAQGLPEILDFCRKLIQRLQSPVRRDWDVVLTNGGGDGLNKIASTLVSHGDTVLVEEFTFMPTVWSIVEAGGEAISLKLAYGQDGIDVDHMAHMLENWHTLHPEKRKPHVLYTVATGQNPTGMSQSLETRQRIYDLCCKHDIVIMEDDPYGYIVLEPYTGPGSGTANSLKSGLKPGQVSYASVPEYEASLYKSFLSIDTEGRVLRCESFSKLISPGIRLGFVVANKFFIQKMVHLTMLTSKFASGATSAMVNALLQYWGGVDGYLRWGMEICKVYSRRKNLYMAALHETQSFKEGHLSVMDPSAGMFVSFFARFPGLKGSMEEAMRVLDNECLRKGVDVVLAGLELCADGDIGEDKKSLIRSTFVAVSNDDEELREGVRRLDAAIQATVKKVCV